MRTTAFHILILLFLWRCSPSEKQIPDESYYIETIQLPDGLEGETGAIEFLPDGRLVACFLRGEVMIYNPVSREWSVFATGLHEPLGLLIVSESEMLVMQRPELTRILDTDNDGQADVYETVTDDFGMTGNYHEWNYGPVKNKEGNLFIGLNTGSEWGILMEEVRGKLDTTLVPGKPKQKFSAVPYRGWIMKITPDGEVIPYAYGFRSPNGLVIDKEGNLFVADNQGDWVGTSKLYHVKEGKFYGHPASLLWTDGWDRGDPSKLPVVELNEMRTRASVLFPHGIMSSSPSQPVIDYTGDKFGPFSGQIFIGEMNIERIMRVMLEEVDGQLQGACMPFFDGKGLKKGNNRLAFSPDGSLWTGHTEYNFAGDKGIQRIVFTGKPPMDIYSMNITPDGFDMTFTQPVNDSIASIPDNYSFRHYYYDYHLKYGSDQYDIQEIPVSSTRVSGDGRKVSLILGEMKPGYVYELTLRNIASENGEPLANALICYTVNKLKQ
ncbi:MAG: PQQ-dependent sugar dehydrogenase [Bacteroidetes bacterium]|nr:PQQ-dependent sugar dehydrogenase [Bacteroidota bacterium]MDA1121678.1 PQQ-dependent sugar dehydrogenase [Bacteroidota bacterium]